MILPCTNSKIRAECTQRPSFGCKVTDFLSLDVEQDLARLINMECELHKAQEDLKQRLASKEDYSDEAVWGALDAGNLGFLDQKSFDTFLKRLKRRVTEDQLVALTRRVEEDQDSTHRFHRDEFLRYVYP